MRSFCYTLTTVITYTYKAKLNPHTHRNLAEFLAQQRMLYNGALQERLDCYQKTGGSIGLYDQRGSLTKIRQDDGWFRKFDRWCQDSALVRVDRAFQRFFKQGHGFPRFKAYRRGVQSFETLHKKPTFKGKYGYVKLKGIGRLRWRLDGRCDDRHEVKVVRVVKHPTGVFVQLVCDEQVRRSGLRHAICIDVGVHSCAALSNGTVFLGHRQDQADIKRKQRALSRSLTVGFQAATEATPGVGAGILPRPRASAPRCSPSHERDRQGPWQVVCGRRSRHPGDDGIGI